MPVNLLAKEKSPYLLQHADNPVMWYPWGDTAFQEARSGNKPILLSIGYSTCHWCHVMAHESFEDHEIAAVINAHFIAVKVDREERPDIDHIYMSAVTAMTGQGGWPLTVFLTPDGKPFYGGTYFPPISKWGTPGFKDVLSSVAQAWQEREGDLQLSAAQVMVHIDRSKSTGPTTHAFDSDIFDTLLTMIAAQFDVDNGGFGSHPKFPMGHQLSLLLRIYVRTKDDQALSMVEKTLQAMADGGIYDHLGGGFHRYSTDAKWHVPHFEKMLYDQALLIMAYAEAYQVTGRYIYAQIIQETAAYVLRELRAPAGGFYSAQDADTDGQEGKSYVFTYEEINTVLGPEHAAYFIKAYGIEPEGNVGHDPQGEFIHQNVLFFNQEQYQRDDAVLVQCRERLLAYRCTRHQPGLDDKVLTDWNGLTIAALSFAGAVLNRSDYIDAAEKAAGFIEKHISDVQGLRHRFRDGEAAIDGMLDDYAFFVLGLICLYETTGKGVYLDRAQAYGDQMIGHFFDTTTGSFFMTKADCPHQLFRPKVIHDGAIPSGNAAAAMGLKKLYQLTKIKRYNDCLEQFLSCVDQEARAHPLGFTYYWQVLDYYLSPGLDVKIKADLNDPMLMEKLRQIMFKHFIPYKSICYESGGLSIEVCRDQRCLPPVKDISSLAALLVPGGCI